jgi:hypothetical protein
MPDNTNGDSGTSELGRILTAQAQSPQRPAEDKACMLLPLANTCASSCV